MSNCPVCHSNCSTSSEQDPLHDCPRCGKFYASLSGIDPKYGIGYFTNPPFELSHESILVSQFIRKSQKDISEYGRDEHSRIKYPRINKDIVEEIKNNFLPSVVEQVDSVLEYIGKKSKLFGRNTYLDDSDLNAMAAYAATYLNTVYYILKTIHERKFVELRVIPKGDGLNNYENVYLTFEGWQRYEEIRKGKTANNKAFMAMQFGNDDLNMMLNDHFKPAVKLTGYDLFKLDDQSEAGLIDVRMQKEIKNCKFVIADLTHGNKGSYWEAGFAEGLGKKVIYTCEKSIFEKDKTAENKVIHFDVNHHQTILWDKDSPHEAISKLKATIRYTFPEARQQDSDD